MAGLGRGVEDASSSEPSSVNTPYLLLWTTGIAAAVLSFIAFLLWGTIGAGALLDMIVALCT